MLNGRMHFIIGTVDGKINMDKCSDCLVKQVGGFSILDQRQKSAIRTLLTQKESFRERALEQDSCLSEHQKNRFLLQFTLAGGVYVNGIHPVLVLALTHTYTYFISRGKTSPHLSSFPPIRFFVHCQTLDESPHLHPLYNSHTPLMGSQWQHCLLCSHWVQDFIHWSTNIVYSTRVIVVYRLYACYWQINQSSNATLCSWEYCWSRRFILWQRRIMAQDHNWKIDGNINGF